jgi:hypothetical protein
MECRAYRAGASGSATEVAGQQAKADNTTAMLRGN